MFTDQVEQLERLQGQLPDDALTVLKNILGQCQQRLEHRGPVHINLGPELSRGVPKKTCSDDPVYAALTVRNYNSLMKLANDNTTVDITNGVAHMVQGGVKIQVNEEDTVALCTNGTIFAGHLVAPKLSVNGQVLVKRWAKTVENWQYDTTVPSKGGGCSWVSARVCEDCAGTNPSGDAFDIYLPVGGGEDPNIESGNVIAFVPTEDGEFSANGYGDDAVRTIKHWGDSVAQIPQGWACMNGTDNGAENGGTGLNIEGLFIRNTCSQGLVQTTGGSDTATVNPHDAADIIAILAGVVAEAAVLVYAYVSGYTDYDSTLAYTDITIEDHYDHAHNVIDVTVESVDNNIDGTTVDVVGDSNPLTIYTDCVQDCDDPQNTAADPYVLAHDMNDPGHYHYHRHWIGNAFAYAEAYAHAHAFTFVAVGTGQLDHDPISTVPKHIYLVPIERLNNGVDSPA